MSKNKNKNKNDEESGDKLTGLTSQEFSQLKTIVQNFNKLPSTEKITFPFAFGLDASIDIVYSGYFSHYEDAYAAEPFSLNIIVKGKKLTKAEMIIIKDLVLPNCQYDEYFYFGGKNFPLAAKKIDELNTRIEDVVTEFGLFVTKALTDRGIKTMDEIEHSISILLNVLFQQIPCSSNGYPNGQKIADIKEYIESVLESQVKSKQVKDSGEYKLFLKLENKFRNGSKC